MNDNSYVYSYDDETHDRFYEVRIWFDTEEPYTEPRSWDCPGYHIPGQIYVTSVEVLMVEYYDREGNVIDVIHRPPNAENAPGWKNLDALEEARICDWVDNGDCICDDLWENRG
ncbi:MAG: hypothetical protein ACYTFQ_21255 [Planctomycetota bacterium]|jgi:hypothetical protein